MGYDIEDDQLEIENRIKNLCWTVSGDYNLDIKPDVESFAKSKYISLYDAVKQGAFARFFHKEQFAMYIVKKIYYGAGESQLMSLAQLCVDASVYDKVLAERPGVRSIRIKAFEAMLEYDFGRMTQSLGGRIKICLLRGTLAGKYTGEKQLLEYAQKINSLSETTDTMDVIKMVDWLYNNLIDKSFEKKHGDLEHVLAVTLEELVEFDWKDFLNEEISEEFLEQYVDKVTTDLTSMREFEEEPGQETAEPRRAGKSVIVLDEKAVAKVYGFIEQTYGKSYLSEIEQKRLNSSLCTGAHVGCSLYFTDGILHQPVRVNAQYVNAKKHVEKNKIVYHNNQRLAKRHIERMTDSLRHALIIRNETEYIRSDFGQILPRHLWRIGRTEPGKLFQKIEKKDNSEFVVDILMDASGSQRDRQGQVALQAYIICEALTNVGIPHRVMSFCTFWDYTVMQRLREYDAPGAENKKALEFTTSSNNRDGLAIRAAGASLYRRPEENKILIVLSDGRPNDVIVNRPGSRNPKTYGGEYAVADTAFEVRKLRNQGIYVLGVFAGKEKDLPAEKKIFGKDFAYIRDIRKFAEVTGVYLKKLLEW